MFSFLGHIAVDGALPLLMLSTAATLSGEGAACRHRLGRPGRQSGGRLLGAGTQRAGHWPQLRAARLPAKLDGLLLPPLLFLMLRFRGCGGHASGIRPQGLGDCANPRVVASFLL